MTNMQLSFLRVLTEELQSAEEICHKLNIEPEANNPNGGYLVALKETCSLEIGNEDNELYGLYEVVNNPFNIYNKDEFYITRRGLEYLKSRIAK